MKALLRLPPVHTLAPDRTASLITPSTCRLLRGGEGKILPRGWYGAEGAIRVIEIIIAFVLIGGEIQVSYLQGFPGMHIAFFKNKFAIHP